MCLICMSVGSCVEAKGPVNAAVQLAGLTSNSSVFASHLTIIVLGFRVCTIILVSVSC